MSKAEREDVSYGWNVAQEIGRMDVGQCVVVKDRVIVAVEAVEGTDEAIRRGGPIGSERRGRREMLQNLNRIYDLIYPRLVRKPFT